MATFYQLFFLTKQSNTKQILSVASLFFANLLATFSIIFKLQNHTRLIDTAVLFIIFLLYYYGSHVRLKKVTDFILHLPVFICVMLLFKSSQIVIHLSALLALVMYIATFSSRLNKAFLRNILLSFTFILLCFFTVHFSYLAIASVFLALLFLIIKEGDDALLNTFQVTSILILFFILVVFSVYPIFLHNLEQQFGLLIQTTPLISFVLYAVSLTIVFWQLKPKTVLYSSAVIAIVAVSTLAYSSFHAGQIIPEREKKQKLTTSRTIAGRMGGLAQHATHNPRLYMWLSVPPWVMDRPIFGTGPDTVRFLYPRYRHPEYGNAEGGHNFTPDRLHNEYFNTITTVGIFGFVVKYIFLFGGWYLILIRLFNKHINSNKKLVIMGALCAPTIYSIQVIFNFGVVATLFLFYFLMGLGLSFVNDEYEHEN